MADCKLKSEMDYRDVLQQNFCKLKTNENYEKYKRQRNKVNNLIKRAKKTTTKTCWMKTPKTLLHSGEN